MEIVNQRTNMNMNTQHKYQLHIEQLFECIWNRVDIINWEHRMIGARNVPALNLTI